MFSHGWIGLSILTWAIPSAASCDLADVLLRTPRPAGISEAAYRIQLKRSAEVPCGLRRDNITRNRSVPRPRQVHTSGQIVERYEALGFPL